MPIRNQPSPEDSPPDIPNPANATSHSERLKLLQAEEINSDMLRALGEKLHPLVPVAVVSALAMLQEWTVDTTKKALEARREKDDAIMIAGIACSLVATKLTNILSTVIRECYQVNTHDEAIAACMDKLKKITSLNSDILDALGDLQQCAEEEEREDKKAVESSTLKKPQFDNEPNLWS